MFLLVKAKYLCYSLLDLSIKAFFLYLDRLLVRNKKYFIPLVIIISLVLSSIFSVPNILGIRNSYVTAGFTIKVNRFFITSI
jgi:hypothetical protein